MTDETPAPNRGAGASMAATPTRRTLLRGAVLLGVGLPLVVACGSGDDGGTSDGGTGGSDTGSSGGQPLAKTTEVPEGGGIILDDPGVVITQPSADEFKGFTNICTHMHCPVDNVTDGTINCTCHGSKYSIEDGSVVRGPAPAPLAAKTLAIKGKNISLA